MKERKLFSVGYRIDWKLICTSEMIQKTILLVKINFQRKNARNSKRRGNVVKPMLRKNAKKPVAIVMISQRHLQQPLVRIKLTLRNVKIKRRMVNVNSLKNNAN